MTLDEARAFRDAITAAIEQAEAEGRDHLIESDLAEFANADDEARAALSAAIAIANAKD